MNLRSQSRNRLNKSRTSPVYFLKIDASGHSTIVVNNPSDVVNLFFDHFENTVIGTVEETRKLRRCGYAEFWGWEGDGGLCVIYDESESVALQTAVESGISILNYKLQPLQDALKQLGARGELHVRIALHGGSFRYKGYKSHGSIHSKDLNFVAHLEEVTPRDTLAVSRDVQQRCPTDLAKRFWLLPFRFEDHEIYVYSNRAHPDVVHEWVSRVPIAGSVAANILPHRYSEENKANIVEYASVAERLTTRATCDPCSQEVSHGHHQVDCAQWRRGA